MGALSLTPQVSQAGHGLSFPVYFREWPHVPSPSPHKGHELGMASQTPNDLKGIQVSPPSPHRCAEWGTASQTPNDSLQVPPPSQSPNDSPS